jgi:endogenous inhibitor of DNA gyrase (YacG/DUF329 family)
MATVRCPDCGEGLAVPTGARPGDLLDCPNCAGLSLRLTEEAGAWAAAIAHHASCPSCGTSILLAPEARAGDVIACCGRAWRLTYEYGAFALEPA